MTDLKAKRIVIQGVIEWLDGSQQKVNFQVEPSIFFGRPGTFRDVEVFVAHEEVAPYNLKLRTTNGVENVERGNLVSIAGESVKVPIEKPTAPFQHDRVKVIEAGTAWAAFKKS